MANGADRTFFLADAGVYRRIGRSRGYSAASGLATYGGGSVEAIKRVTSQVFAVSLASVLFHEQMTKPNDRYRDYLHRCADDCVVKLIPFYCAD